MPFYTNTAQGTLNYSAGIINSQLILPNDTAANNSATLSAIDEFKLRVGKYERFILKYTLFTTHDATSDIKVKVDVPASPTIYRAQLVSGGAEGTTTLTAEGDLALTTATANDVVEIKAVVQNGANAGDITFSFAERNDSGSGVTVLGGSYLEYIKF
tara:strand:+ start:39 stop:509 length:471 start_codon:yes stop_codon:yes gene_type:complete